jgi:hypothetical protein
MTTRKQIFLMLVFTTLLVSACNSQPEVVTITSQPDPGITALTTPETQERDLEIITLLPRDGIPAIDDPTFLTPGEADEEYAPEELVIGVEFNEDARAYSIPFLSGHEIVNDTVGGVQIAVTW